MLHKRSTVKGINVFNERFSPLGRIVKQRREIFPNICYFLYPVFFLLHRSTRNKWRILLMTTWLKVQYILYFGIALFSVNSTVFAWWRHLQAGTAEPGGLGVAPPLLLSHGKRTYLNERRTTGDESGRTLLELLHLLFSDFPLAL